MTRAGIVPALSSTSMPARRTATVARALLEAGRIEGAERRDRAAAADHGLEQVEFGEKPGDEQIGRMVIEFLAGADLDQCAIL